LTDRTFIAFLLDTPTGKAYYRSSTGTILTSVVTAGSDVSLKEMPGNWLDAELTFVRNLTYHGINRSYSNPLEFVRDAKKMIEELMLEGAGTEVPLTYALFEYNKNKQAGEPDYKLYYKGNLDLKESEGTILESLSVNLMEGGVARLLKSYENTVLEIPCDGSIVENIKCNYDGMRVKDKLFYTFVPFTNYSNLVSTLPAIFVNNEGDNYGTSINSPRYEDTSGYASPTRFFFDTPNYTVFYSKNTQVTLNGYIIVSPTILQPNVTDSTPFNMYLKSSLDGSFVRWITQPGMLIKKTTRIDFNEVVNLRPSEKLIIAFQDTAPITVSKINVIGGEFTVEFDSQANATRAWGVSLGDLYKKAIKRICEIASTTGQTFDYTATSELLDAYPQLFINSGDALRASGDPNYQKFYYIGENNQIQYGPVIKTTLKKIFETAECLLSAGLGTRNNRSEEIYIESLSDIYDSSSVNYSVGEIARLKWKYADNLMFSDLKIGYEPQQYDQKAGKYEYNTTLEMKAPINSFQKTLEKICPVRFDSYGIERVRTNIGATSTTRNTGDSSLFGAVIDRNSFIYDYFRATFLSDIENPDDPNNTNVHLSASINSQSVSQPVTDGEYFKSSFDYGILVFSEAGYSATESCNLTITGVVNSVNHNPLQPDDTITFKFWHNGTVLYQETITVTGINTPIDIDHDFTQALAYKDCIYVTVETSTTAEAQIYTSSFTAGSYVQVSGENIPVLSGVSQQLISMPNFDVLAVADSIQSGFQYFTFNSLAVNTNFNLSVGARGYIEPGAGIFEAELYINGVLQPDKITVNSALTRVTFVRTLGPINRDFSLNDIIFLAATPDGLDVGIQSLLTTVESTQIKCYSLKRKQYDNLSGVPNLATDSSGNIRTDIAGAPYNIEDVTPKRIYRRWRDYLMSCFMDVVTGWMKFQTLSKNKFLSTTYGGETIIENSDEEILGFNRLFYPIEIEGSFECPDTFAELMSSSINGHVHGTYFGKDIYFFVNEIKQKPALNESTRFKAILSPRTKPSELLNLSSFKIPEMSPNSINNAFISTLQFVPIVRELPDKYHTANRNYFLYCEQVSRWLDRTGYAQPVQIGDQLTLANITHSLDPIFYTVYKYEDDSIYEGPTNIDTNASPSINDPYVNWIKYLNTSGWERGFYYVKISSTVGDLLISEKIQVGTKEEMYDTVLIEATNSFNTQGMVFDGVTPLIINKRFYGGFDNSFKQKYLGKFYIDQPADITILNAIPYEVGSLYIGGRYGVPDHEMRRIFRLLLLDDCKLDGEGFTLNEGAELDYIFTKGAPKKIGKLEIRPKNNRSSISVTTEGIDEDNSMIVSVSPGAFGPNITNQSGTADTELIDIIVS
jgi:hypothetical protein